MMIPKHDTEDAEDATSTRDGDLVKYPIKHENDGETVHYGDRTLSGTVSKRDNEHVNRNCNEQDFVPNSEADERDDQSDTRSPWEHLAGTGITDREGHVDTGDDISSEMGRAYRAEGRPSFVLEGFEESTSAISATKDPYMKLWIQGKFGTLQYQHNKNFDGAMRLSEVLRETEQDDNVKVDGGEEPIERHADKGPKRFATNEARDEQSTN
ncbi:MAG: hypothetical protein Q9180_005379 [Flavoplaca navasiana]